MPEKSIGNVAYIVQRICSITGVKPGKTALQKIVYLIEADGVDLGFQYKAHCYGPFSETLDAVINRLIAENTLRVETKGNSHLMDVDGSCNVESDLGKETEAKIDRVIEKCKEKKPSELGLLATAHYVMKKSPDLDIPGIVRGVQKIVGTKYREETIKAVLSELNLPA